MEHRMILMDADFKTVHKVVIARRKENASLAQMEERHIRNVKAEDSISSTGSTFDESE